MIQFAHFMFFFVCAAASLGKNAIVWQAPVSAAKLNQLRMLDKITASAAGLLTLSGLAMVFWLAKPSAYYLGSGIFWLKMALFIAASALVVWTKVDFRRAASAATEWKVPLRVRAILAFDFVGLIVLAFLGRTLAM